MTLSQRLVIQEREDCVAVVWHGGKGGKHTGTVVQRPRYVPGSHVMRFDHLYAIAANGVLESLTATEDGTIRELLSFGVRIVEPGRVVALIEPDTVLHHTRTPPPWSEHKIARVEMPAPPPALPAFTCSGDTKHQTYKHDIKAGEWLRTLHGTIGKTEEDIFLGHVLDAALLAFSTLTPAEQRAYVMRAQGLTAGLTAAVKPLNTAV